MSITYNRSMFENARIELSARFYTRSIEKLVATLPESFFTTAEITKSSIDFKIYRQIIGRYIALLRQTERQDPRVMKRLQEIRLKKILAIANTTPWWQNYFKVN